MLPHQFDNLSIGGVSSQPGSSSFGASHVGASPHGASPHGVPPYGASPYRVSPYGIPPHGASPRLMSERRLFQPRLLQHLPMRQVPMGLLGSKPQSLTLTFTSLLHHEHTRLKRLTMDQLSVKDARHHLWRRRLHQAGPGTDVATLQQAYRDQCMRELRVLASNLVLVVAGEGALVVLTIRHRIEELPRRTRLLLVPKASPQQEYRRYLTQRLERSPTA